MRLRYFLFNALFLALLMGGFYQIQPVLLQHLVITYQTRQPDGLVLSLILVMSLLELTGLWFKWPILASQIGQNAPISRWVAFCSGILVLMCRGLVELFSGFFLMIASGTNDFNTFWQCLLGPPLLIFFFLKMAVVLTAIYGLIFPQATATYPVVRGWQPWLGDTLMTLGSAMAFTVSWDVGVAISPPLADQSWAAYIPTAFWYVICFFPSRAFFTLEEWLLPQPWFQRLVSGLVFIASMALALMSLTS
jgi:hypothetical protein